MNGLSEAEPSLAPARAARRGNPPRSEVPPAHVGASDGERSVVLLWAEGYSYEEIAHDLGISRSNAGVVLCRARKRLFDRFGSAAGVSA